MVFIRPLLHAGAVPPQNVGPFTGRDRAGSALGSPETLARPRSSAAAGYPHIDSGFGFPCS